MNLLASRLLAAFCLTLTLASCGHSSSNADAGVDGGNTDAATDAATNTDTSDTSTATELALGPAIEFRENAGRSQVQAMAAGVSSEGVLAAASVGARIVARRFAIDGTLLSDEDLDVAEEGYVLSVEAAPGGWLVTWTNRRTSTLHHAVVQSDGSGVGDTIDGGVFRFFEDHFVMAHVLDGAANSWVGECVPTGFGQRCALIRRVAPLDGSEATNAVVWSFETPYDGGPVGTMSPSGGAIVWVGEENLVRLQYLDSTGAPDGSGHELGTYTPTARPQGLLDAPLAVALREDGVALITKEELVTVALDGTLIAERATDFNSSLVATLSGYRFVNRSFDSVQVQTVSPDGTPVSTCAFTIEGELLPRMPPAALPIVAVGDDVLVLRVWSANHWGAGGAQVRALRADGCEEIGQWQTPFDLYYPGNVRTEWLADSGLALISAGDGETPSMQTVRSAREVRVLGLDGSVGPERVLPTESVEDFLATDSTYWLRYRDRIVVLDSAGAMVREEPIGDVRPVWGGGAGYYIEQRDDAPPRMQRVDALFQPTGEAQVLAIDWIPYEIRAAGDGLLWVTNYNQSAIVDSNTGALLTEIDDVDYGGYTSFDTCGASCWTVLGVDRSERFEWRGDGGFVERVELPRIFTGDTPVFSFVFAGPNLVVTSTSAIRHFGSSLAVLDMVDLDDEPLRVQLSAVSATRLALAYEAMDERGRVFSRFRFVDLE